MHRALLIVLLGILNVSCGPKWIAYPQNVKSYEQCKPFNSDPQLTKVPGFNAYIMTKGGNCHIMDRQRVSIAMIFFLEEWSNIFPYSLDKDLVEKAISELLIEFSWEEKRRNAYSADGRRLNQVQVSGLATSPGTIWVKARPGDLICQTSFIHELAHIGIWAIKKTDGDPDHLGPKYFGWTPRHNVLIQRVNKILCEIGI